MPHGPSVTSRALAILGAFDQAHPQLSLTEVAERTGLPLSTAHRLVAELADWGALERASDQRYYIGRRLWQLGTLAPVHRGLRDIALPPMQDVYSITRENVHLAVRSGTTALYIERIYGAASVKIVSRPGSHLPMHATGVGKVLLAYAPDDVRAQVLSALTPVTRYTITERGRLSRELAGVRRHGYASTAEEMTMGTCSVAVPVADREGRVVAALGLVARNLRRDLVQHVPVLRVAAAAIGRAIPSDLVDGDFHPPE